jgi:hypothetical protein
LKDGRDCIGIQKRTDFSVDKRLQIVLRNADRKEGIRKVFRNVSGILKLSTNANGYSSGGEMGGIVLFSVAIE